ncbi:amino acid ABC transporter substrate-binding protein [Pseudomonas alcaligenes]|uniref:Amino acid ABC transporter substrate-binding protein n=1 Tax=Aquipseudomonas alcaligenes TaxID=43263 RepID=A0ABR7S0R2_AQUAC|nr:transporter substrate-binding domain-containing protein [Pseudomonas alcaligenes]MBC9250171.1 amino acid ABC transporter substrate-binding protein [Pseudomonas alcaligenes]
MQRLGQGCLGTLLFLSALAPAPLLAAQEVLIAAVQFPPYVIKPEKDVHLGLLAELVDSLNRAQQDYHFDLRATSLNRRFADFQKGRFDMAIFENPDWDWQGIAGTRIDLGLEDSEVFVARAETGRGQDYFDNLMDKRIALFNGYHYGFAGFNNDPDWLARNFKVQITYSHESNLNLVLRNRADVAPITRSWLGSYLHERPELQAKLLVSNWVDQVYRHYAILRPEAPISAERFRQLMQTLRDDGELLRIFSPYGIKVTPRVAGSSAAQSAAD